MIDAIKSLHWLYGKGDLISITLFNDVVTIVAKRTSCEPHTVIGRIANGRTVFIYGHQRTVRVGKLSDGITVSHIDA